MSIRNPKVTALQNEIAERQASLRAILLTERDAAKALLAETEEALGDLGGEGGRSFPVIVQGAVSPLAAVGRRIGRTTDALVKVYARVGPMTARQSSALANVNFGSAVSALSRLEREGIVRTVERQPIRPGSKRSNRVYELTGKV